MGELLHLMRAPNTDDSVDPMPYVTTSPAFLKDWNVGAIEGNGVDTLRPKHDSEGWHHHGNHHGLDGAEAIINAVLQRTMDDVARSMNRWTEIIDTQVDELHKNCTALRRFNEAV